MLNRMLAALGVLEPPPPPDAGGKPETIEEPPAFTAFVSLDSGLPYAMDVIRWGGFQWLVPVWREAAEEGQAASEEGWLMPDRIILLDWLRQKKLSKRQLLLQGRIPRSILFDPDPSPRNRMFVVHMRPNLRMRRSYWPALDAKLAQGRSLN
jgi:hypothetical protein